MRSAYPHTWLVGALLAASTCPIGGAFKSTLGAPCTSSNDAGAIVTAPGQCVLYFRSCDTTQPAGACTKACSEEGNWGECSEAGRVAGVCTRVNGSLQCALQCELDGGCVPSVLCPEPDAGCPTRCCRSGYTCEPVPVLDGGAVIGSCVPGG